MKPTKTIQITYIHGHAFTKCDCGKEMGLVNFRSNVYEGSCIYCQKKYKLINNKLMDA